MRNTKPVESIILPTAPERDDNGTPKQDKSSIILPSSEPGAQLSKTPYEPDISTYPYSCCGAIFTVDDKGNDIMGTAAFVGTNWIVMTATHAVRNGTNGIWYTKRTLRAVGAENRYKPQGSQSRGWTIRRAILPTTTRSARSHLINTIVAFSHHLLPPVSN